jgi:hypothetical protein
MRFLKPECREAVVNGPLNRASLRLGEPTKWTPRSTSLESRSPLRRRSRLHQPPLRLRQFAEVTLQPGAHEHAVVLAPVKERPGNIAASFTVNLRDEKMLSAEQKDCQKKEDRMASNSIP